MSTLAGRIAWITGGSRGVGKGIALSLGAQGATVYITGRTLDTPHTTVPLPGTLKDTAAGVDQAGGKGIAVQCDHRDDVQVQAVIERIKTEQGRLDILVNNAWAGYEGYIDDQYLPPNAPFWQKPVTFWDDNLIGVRWAYVASTYATPLLIASGGGLIVNLSYSPLIPGNPAYNVAKQAADRLAFEMAHALREYHVAAVALHPGLVRTELVLKNAHYFDMSNSESPQFTGRAVTALAADPDIMQKSGQALVVAQLAQDYDFDDIDGTRPTPVTL